MPKHSVHLKWLITTEHFVSTFENKNTNYEFIEIKRNIHRIMKKIVVFDLKIKFFLWCFKQSTNRNHFRFRFFHICWHSSFFERISTHPIRRLFVWTTKPQRRPTRNVLDLYRNGSKIEKTLRCLHHNKRNQWIHNDAC